MNWEAIGAVGEVLGAIGVIVTLGYLAVQIRPTREQCGPNPGVPGARVQGT